MPWIRIDENAMDHPKFLALSDGAWRLWCEGQAYCQKHLTDGVIPSAALKGFRYYSPLRVKNLTESHVPGKSACWHVTEDGSFQVHDFLVWNDSRESVLEKREAAKKRMNVKRSREHPTERTANTPCGVVLVGSGSSKKEEGVGETTTHARAGQFCEWYADTHERLFHVGYFGTNMDYQKAQELCAKFTDQQLRDAALVWFGMDDDFATAGTRSIGKFASRITGCLQAIKARGIA